MANIFMLMKQSIGLLNAEKRFCRDTAKLELIQEKVDALEEVFDFAKEYAPSANHQVFSTVEERLWFYLTEGNLNYHKVADRFGVSVQAVAGNVHYASREFSDLVGSQINQINDAGDIEAVWEALSEFRNIRKSVVNPHDLSEISEELLKSLLKRKKYKIGGVEYAKNTPPIIIP
ncbi:MULTISPECIES: hypothetical protein [Paenibacillus]|uniref:RNA polymerase sigma factor 70 region 4 type 2 domain-containing protein n=1 Tax=Paenibacillus odorifer TaxID=189426 RepID=A0ABX3HFW1_9BACL|nr:hypothetical protein [Paenibacillus odorifer]OMD48519.1 hypothetical protein BSK51_21550 [Paenibacillus odorifer]